jgi:hypothetical protein
VNALFFICYSFANFSAVWLFGHVVPTLGFNTMFNILGLMAVVALVIHTRVETFKITEMPFVTGIKGYEAVALTLTPGLTPETQEQETVKDEQIKTQVN